MAVPPSTISARSAAFHAFLRGARQHPTASDASTVSDFLSRTPELASLQEEETGKSPLMAAAEIPSLHLLETLLAAGAPWNAVDRRGRCAGDYAVAAGSQECVDLLVEAGTKAELLLSASGRLDKASLPATVVEAGESDAVGYQPCTKPDYLSGGVRYDGDSLLDEDDDAVMMEWERPLMSLHADVITSDEKGKRVLNVGFGMGIVDGYLAGKEPGHHTIVEAHPGVHEKMVKDGWTEKANTTVLFGRWQDVIKDIPDHSL
ncbi:hypothetical protein TeGR_g3697 [Tetraparma gracilis]|uniref:Protein arginine N-methyltransferase 2 n=1 Tax=Tetraparma gracilis TaxID=2962635 RepID=A0ABQ6M8G2_9STRA|nr:hypothetical protein TeGR_g3697 [Tetraparma gracilis]